MRAIGTTKLVLLDYYMKFISLASYSSHVSKLCHVYLQNSNIIVMIAFHLY